MIGIVALTYHFPASEIMAMDFADLRWWAAMAVNLPPKGA